MNDCITEVLKMYDIFLKQINIEHVRHLNNVTIPISDDTRKHLIITGKNGSGKTSLLKALSVQLNYLATTGSINDIKNNIDIYQNGVDSLKRQGASDNQIAQEENRVTHYKSIYENAKAGLELVFNVADDGIRTHFENGDFVLAYYEATRKFDAIIPKHVEKVELKNYYRIEESPRNEFVKYILDLKMTEALASNSGKTDKADKIHAWFTSFEDLLKQIFDDDSVKLLFDDETFAFSIHQDGREPFDFKELSDGFAAILDIVVDLMVRMEKRLEREFGFDMPGIVLIDEIETHLHLDLQRTVLEFLMKVFPNIQFIVSTHSPFILSSAKNAVIYDLEKRVLVQDGLTGLPYDGVVRSYFEVDNLSEELRSKFNRYKELVNKQSISDDEMEEIANIEMYLDEIPDYLALEVTTEYLRLKNEFAKRGDL